MMKEETFVPLIVNGTKVQLGLTKKTTCDQVIKMAVSNHKSFAVYEIHDGVEKILPRNTKLLKQVRTWGINRHDYTLKIKEIPNKRKPRMASLQRAKEAFSRLQSLLKPNDHRETTNSGGEDVMNNLDNNEIDFTESYKRFPKNISSTNERDTNNLNTNVNMDSPQLEGKVKLMSRYLQDTMLSLREDSIDHTTNNETSDNNETRMTISHDFGNDMNMAFLTNESYAETSTDITDNLNDCMLYEDTEDESTEDDESAFEDVSDCSSLDDLERNITIEELDNTLMNLNELKSAFSNGDLNARVLEDSILESFMNTAVNHHEFDEGVSSAGSDFE